MPTAKQRANWARFAKMARARSRAKRSTRRASRSTPKRAPRRRRASLRSYMPRRTRRTSRRGSRRSKKSFNIATTAVAVNGLAQMIEPFLSAGVIGAIQSKDPQALIVALRAGGKEATSLSNLIQAAGPAIGLKILRKLASGLGVTAPRVAGVRAF